MIRRAKPETPLQNDVVPLTWQLITFRISAPVHDILASTWEFPGVHAACQCIELQEYVMPPENNKVQSRIDHTRAARCKPLQCKGSLLLLLATAAFVVITLTALQPLVQRFNVTLSHVSFKHSIATGILNTQLSNKQK